MSNDEVSKAGFVNVVASSGKKKDSEVNMPGSQADPYLNRDYSLPQRKFQETNYSKVGLTLGLTKSLGNFEFARIDVYAEDFCEPSKKQETWDGLNDLATKYVVKTVKELEDYIKDKKATAGKGMGF